MTRVDWKKLEETIRKLEKTEKKSLKNIKRRLRKIIGDCKKTERRLEDTVEDAIPKKVTPCAAKQIVNTRGAARGSGDARTTYTRPSTMPGKKEIPNGTFPQAPPARRPARLAATPPTRATLTPESRLPRGHCLLRREFGIYVHSLYILDFMFVAPKKKKKK
ncbi:hypothetical protein E2C01_085545 [Portunus trituberculatus]|uniref:Uncharacterized protein n=1 Tax=Portunus trituberculatus TaxID=210409 RepID=A0A5B7J313_PORTR|nr:hypothetical protein [Portunus trituberculatus]